MGQAASTSVPAALVSNPGPTAAYSGGPAFPLSPTSSEAHGAAAFPLWETREMGPLMYGRIKTEARYVQEVSGFLDFHRYLRVTITLENVEYLAYVYLEFLYETDAPKTPGPNLVSGLKYWELAMGGYCCRSPLCYGTDGESSSGAIPCVRGHCNKASSGSGLEACLFTTLGAWWLASARGILY